MPDPETSASPLNSLSVANVVIAAGQFNPSVFSQLWLARTGLAREDQLQSESDNIFSSQLAQVVTPDFRLIVVPASLQFFPSTSQWAHGDFVSATIAKIVGTLPHVPYTAAGMNFVYIAPLPEPNARTRSLFAPPAAALHEFETDDARFGTYVSRDVGFARLKLTILPALGRVRDQQTEVLQAHFNFHVDLPSDPLQGADRVQSLVKHWDAASAMASRIAEALSE